MAVVRSVIPLAASASIPAGSIVDSHVNATAAIQATKLVADVSAANATQTDTTLQAIAARLDAEITARAGWQGKDGSTLRGIRGAWANRTATPCNIGWTGDSKTEGYFASGETNRFVKRFMRRVYQAANQAYSPGYISMNSFVSYSGETWAISGTSSLNDSGWGWGGVYLNPATTATITVTCDRFWLFYQDKPTLGVAPSITIDGVAVGTGITVATGTKKGGRAWDSGALTPGSHTIVVTGGSVFGSVMEGGMFFLGNGNTSGSQGTLSQANAATGTGVRFWPGGHFGYKTGDFSAAKSTLWWTDGMDFVQPHLMFHALGTNDVSSVAAATSAANAGAIVTQVAAQTTALTLTPCSHCWIINERTAGGDNTAHRRAFWGQAFTSNMAIFDLQTLLGSCQDAANDIYGFMYSGDYVHYSNRGMRAIGEALAEWFIVQMGETETTKFTSVDGYYQVGNRPATAGEIRLPNTGTLQWRNAANSADISALSVNASNNTLINAVTGQSIKLQVNAADILSLTATALTFANAVDIALDTSTGTKIGTATLQKLAFHNATPVIQRAGAAQVAVATTASTQTTPWGFTTQAQADAIVTLTNELRAALVEKGLIKGAA